MPEFNLVDQPWIPCLLRDGGKPQELSLRDTLTGAHEIRELSDTSPLIMVSLHRLLLAILHRNFGPASFSEWKELWQHGQWDSDKLNRYFDVWKHRFNLFDKERPFYQVLRMQNAKGKDVELHPVALLAHEAATGNNATLFDHSFKDAPEAFPAAVAARYLIAHQAFSLGGGVSHPFNLCHAPLVRGFTVLALGNNLFETLALNLLIYNKERPMPQLGNDLPGWEQDSTRQPDKNGTHAQGYLDYLTWQSRRLHLIEPPEEAPDILWCKRLQNLRLADEQMSLDPFKCYREDKEKGLTPLSVDPEKALWRDSHTLFQQTDRSKRRPEVFNFLATIEIARRRGEINAQAAYAFAIYGFATEPPPKAASVRAWTRERLPLPLNYLIEPQLVDDLRLALGLADDISAVLHESIRTLAKLLAAPLSDDRNARQPDPKDVRNIANNFSAHEFYWARLDQPFKKLLTDLPKDFQYKSGDTIQAGDEAMTEWVGTLQRTAHAALENAVNSLSGSARDLKASATAKEHFNRHLGRIRKDYAHLFPVAKPTGGEA
jgi:CRISPR system Cascade subunit CasA